MENTDRPSRLCTCGRSATGFCTGLHRLTDEEWDARVFDESFQATIPTTKENLNEHQ